MSHPHKFHRPRALVIALALACVGASVGAVAQGAPSGADKMFMQKAAIGGMAEVELGKMAQQKGASDEVKQFASRMVDDHSKANAKLMQIASTKSVTLPASLDAKHKSTADKLGKMSGASFDRAYMSEMLKDHKEDVALFQKESKGGADADLKGFASKTLPTLQDHLKMVQDMTASMPKRVSSVR